MATDFLSGDSLYRDVIAYSQMGEHRTATEGDLRTSEWVAEQLEAAGLETSFQPFALRQFFVRESSLVVAGKRVECFPLWPPCGTGPQPILATVAAVGAKSDLQKGRIALVNFPFENKAEMYVKPGSKKAAWEAISAAISTTVEAGALAIVAITEGPSKEIIAYNSPDWLDPWPVPVVMVGWRDEPALAEAAERGAEVSLLVDGKYEPQAKARNVIGRLNRGKEVIVVTTPYSGWFRCGGERGPGVALSLAIARWVVKRQPRTSYLFDFNSGHELHSLGMRNFVKEFAPSPEEVLCWLFLGKNIATWSWEESAAGSRQWADPEKHLIICRNPDLLPLLTSAFADMPGVRPSLGPGLGELRVVPEEYKGFSISSERYRFKHTPADGPEGTAPELLEPVALALSRALESIEASDKW